MENNNPYKWGSESDSENFDDLPVIKKKVPPKKE